MPQDLELQKLVTSMKMKIIEKTTTPLELLTESMLYFHSENWLGDKCRYEPIKKLYVIKIIVNMHEPLA